MPTQTDGQAPVTPTSAAPSLTRVQAPSSDASQTSALTAQNLEGLSAGIGADVAVVLLAGTVIGATLAVVVLPTLLPDLASSVFGDQPKAFWYLSRSAGVVAYLVLWLSMVLGLSLTSRFARLWAGGPAIADVHQFSSLLALALILFHVVVLLGDGYIGYRLDQLLLPFNSTPYEPLWVGLGQVALYLAVPVSFSFYVRRQIGVRAWRLIHYASFAIFVLVLAHGLGAGTDTSSPMMLGLYLCSAGAVVFLTCYRVLMTVGRRRRARMGAARGGPGRWDAGSGVYSLREGWWPEPASAGEPLQTGR